MSSSKKFTCKGTLRQVFVWGPLPSYDPNLPPPPHLYTLYTCIQYTVLIHTGKGGGGIANQR